MNLCWRRQKRGGRKALEDLARVGLPKEGHYAGIDEFMVQHDLTTEYGGEDYSESDGIMKFMILPILRPPEYSLTDMWNVLQGRLFLSELHVG